MNGPLAPCGIRADESIRKVLFLNFTLSARVYI